MVRVFLQFGSRRKWRKCSSKGGRDGGKSVVRGAMRRGRNSRASLPISRCRGTPENRAMFGRCWRSRRERESIRADCHVGSLLTSRLGLALQHG
jgi:hypothetical protein